MARNFDFELSSKRWFYRFILPTGYETESYGPEQLHTDRLIMMQQTIGKTFGDDLTSVTATDIACHQGWFSYHLASSGLKSVTGIDARIEHIECANLIKQAYELENLHLVNHDIFSSEVKALDKTDLVLMYGLLYHLEDPVGALRIASNLAKRLLLIETQVMNMDMTGNIDWGSQKNQIALLGAFGLIYEPDVQNLETGISGLALVPSTGVIIWLLRNFGFTSVEVLKPPANAHEQLVSGNRVVIAATR